MEFDGTVEIEVHLPASLSDYTGGASSALVTGYCLGDIVHELELMFEGLKDKLLDRQDQLRQDVIVVVSDSEVRHVNDLGAPLHEGDEIYIRL